MKLGFQSAIVADESFEQVIDLASEKGFGCVELLSWPRGKAERRYAGVTHVDAEDLSNERIRYIKNYLQRRNVSISALGYYPNPLDNDPDNAKHAIDHIKKVIDATGALGVGVMNTFVGRDHTRSVEDNFSRFREVWPEIVTHAEARGVKIGIENCPMLFTHDEWPGGKNLAFSPSIWRRMFEMIPSRHFGLNYDPSHMIWQHMDYIAPIYEFKDRLYHIHLKDAKLMPERLKQVGILATPLEYHVPKLPGLGDVDWGRFFSALTDIAYDGPVVIEVEDRAYEGSLADRHGALIQSRNYVRQFIAAD
ncbi:MAG TPA: sugar phosphate isomerase/epimerase family protein [Gammaproteobacteria bacterium]|nr:sugar phosphate isomerase/epimerase family protein [Gammaproteobacteria bacterium]